MPARGTMKKVIEAERAAADPSPLATKGLATQPSLGRSRLGQGDETERCAGRTCR